MTDTLHLAAATWNDPAQPLELTNALIHDGWPLDQLDQRADGYVSSIFEPFPQIRPELVRDVLEIGSGTGYIMQGIDRYLRGKGVSPRSIVGLDIAEHMLAKARQRLGERAPYKFLHYDGVDVPLEPSSFDLIYSVAALQHIPKPYVYNLFLEARRLLRPAGFAVLHFLSFRHIPEQVRAEPWAVEVRRQVLGEQGHWHHFYSAEELQYVLRDGTGFPQVDIRDGDSIFVCVGNEP